MFNIGSITDIFFGAFFRAVYFLLGVFALTRVENLPFVGAYVVFHAADTFMVWIVRQTILDKTCTEVMR